MLGKVFAARPKKPLIKNRVEAHLEDAVVRLAHERPVNLMHRAGSVATMLLDRAQN